MEDRVKNRVLLAPMIAEETSKFEKNVLLERLAEAKIAAAPVMTVADVANDPHFRDERSMYTEVTHPPAGSCQDHESGRQDVRDEPLCEGLRSPAGRAQR